MFQDTLLIIKNDYINKRKQVLLKLLQSDFQIQGSRRLLFTPEHAAEFYNHMAEDKNFMLQVILLSKGPSEAFILTKENGVEELYHTMICYFRTSIEMEKNIHVSKSEEDVRREIQFIFPNYIHEPIPTFNPDKFCQSQLLKGLIDEAYSILQTATDYPDQWRVQMADWLVLNNKTLPRISNQCSHKPLISRDDKTCYATGTVKDSCREKLDAKLLAGSSSSTGDSVVMTTSSCMTCSSFEGDDKCLKKPQEEEPGVILFKAKTAKASKGSLTRPAAKHEHFCEEEIEWVECEGEESHCDDDYALIKTASGEIKQDDLAKASKVTQNAIEVESNRIKQDDALQDEN